MPNQCSQCSGSAKYTCPRCSVRTCSLVCCQAHKDLTNCSGIRDKTSFVSVKNFTNFNLLSDYRLLEEAGRVTDNAFRNKNIKRFDLMHNKRELPPWLHRLRVEAKLRGTTLKILPHIFSRRKENSTCYIRKLRKILWRVEWMFVQANVSFSDKKVDEELTIASILGKYFDDCEGSYGKLSPYRDCGLLGVKVLLRAEDRPSTDSKYYKVNLDSTLKDALKRKTITEFPVFLVVLKEHVESYEIIEQELEAPSVVGATVDTREVTESTTVASTTGENRLEVTPDLKVDTSCVEAVTADNSNGGTVAMTLDATGVVTVCC